jgi:hypothetical protein
MITFGKFDGISKVGNQFVVKEGFMCNCQSDYKVCAYIVKHNLLGGMVFTISKAQLLKIYRTIILPVVLYGCETWSLTWRE